VDVSSPASIARLASLAKDHLGGIDVWINNAGYSGSFQVQNNRLLPEPEGSRICGRV
jgi:NAD(P)-dependent dehydrogenase (short-subunit alcohol dehydrogenase family)